MTHDAAEILLNLSERQAEQLEEMRFRAGQPVELVFDGWTEKTPQPFEKMDELIAALCGFARYAYEKQMAQGYIPLEDGHRAGVCGKVMLDKSGSRMTEVTSVCIRIARHISGASLPIRKDLPSPEDSSRRVLLLGVPECGKTTVLRDAAIFLAKQGLHIAVCDERMEFFGGKAPNAALDVMSGADKASAIGMLLRAMSPQVVICDEIGCERDVGALLDAARCGVGILASAHAAKWEDITRRPVLQSLYEAGAFDRYLFLGRHGKRMAAYDAQGMPLENKQGG